jgi:hypothetical protein
MHRDAIPIRDLEHLRNYVQETICSQHELEVNYFRVTERLLVRSGKPCGMYFCLHGPRSTKFTAIWETDRNTVLFYGSTGQRLKKTQLESAPKLRGRAVTEVSR